MSSFELVDVHHHFVPDVYRSAFSQATDSTVGGIPQPNWDLQMTLERMAALEISKSILSISTPALIPIGESARAKLATTCNEAMASLKSERPKQLGGFAVLPMPDLDQSLTELAYALDVLKLDGVSLLTNYHGRYLGHSAFRQILEELNRRHAVVHIHPNLPPAMPQAELMMPGPVLEFTFETTRMVSELILTETLQRYPNIKFILSHLGGTLPWVAWRLSMLDAFPSSVAGRTKREPVIAQLQRLYYDVALSADPAGLRMASELIGIDRLLYGSDFPFAPDDFIDRNAESLTLQLDDLDLRSALARNATDVFHG